MDTNILIWLEDSLKALGLPIYIGSAPKTSQKIDSFIIINPEQNKNTSNSKMDFNGNTFNDDYVNIYVITENNQEFVNANEIAYNVKNSVDDISNFVGNIKVTDNVRIIEILDNRIIYDGIDQQNRFVFNVKVRILWRYTKI